MVYIYKKFMKIEIKSAEEKYFFQIINLLQVISNFYPNPRNEKIIWFFVWLISSER